MTKADYYMKESIENILQYGHRDINPRPHYKDGTPAHTFSVNSVVHKYDISKNENKMRKELAQKYNIEGGMATVPQIIINGKHIGGYTDLKEIVDSGRLNQYLR